MPSAYALETERLVKVFGRRRALAGLDLRVEGGTVYSLIGSNGSGKTTLARIVTGGLRPSFGSFRVLGQHRGRPDRRRVGYMPQDLALYPDLTVLGNLRFFASVMGVRHSKAAATDIAESVQMADRLDDLVRGLSGGLQRRVSLAAALLGEPDLLILDEPTVGVDPVLRAELWSMLRGFAVEGRTVLITTHYMDEAQRSDQVGLLHEGLLLAEGRPADLLAATQTTSLEDAFYQVLEERAARQVHRDDTRVAARVLRRGSGVER